MRRSDTSPFICTAEDLRSSDHKTLVTMMTRQDNRRLYNWSLKLTEFDFVVKYRQGCDNVVADCLSPAAMNLMESRAMRRASISTKSRGGRCGQAHMKKIRGEN